MTPLEDDGDGEALDALLRRFLAEDIGRADVTTEATVPPGTQAQGEIVAKSECVVSGLPVARRVFELLDPELAWSREAPAGVAVSPPAVLARLAGRELGRVPLAVACGAAGLLYGAILDFSTWVTFSGTHTFGGYVAFSGTSLCQRRSRARAPFT